MKTPVMVPTYVRRDRRGMFFEILNGKQFKSLSYGRMRKGAVMGNHYHKKTSVFFFLTSGSVQVDTLSLINKRTEAFALHENQGCLIPPYIFHTMRFEEASTFIMAKTRKYDNKHPDLYTYDIPKR